MNNQTYAEIVVDIPVQSVDRIFHYKVPENLAEQVQFGIRVSVPFGRRTIIGYVVGFCDIVEIEPDKVKSIKSILDDEPVFTSELWSIARWMKAYYLCTIAQALKCIVSPGIKVRGPRELTGLWPNFKKQELESILKEFSGAPKQAQVLKAAVEKPGLTKNELAGVSGVSASTVNTLVEKKLLKPCTYAVRRNPYPIKQSEISAPKLTPEQKKCTEAIIQALNSGRQDVFVLHGVTGSGKTEIYLKTIEHVLSLGHGAIITVPEIALTSQMVKTFKERFGELVAVLHSGLSPGERYDEWQRISRGVSKIVLGARSAVFAPLPTTKLIIIDEEHETSYKQDDQAKYHAREVAITRAKLNRAVVVLGSATLSLETYCRALERGPYRLLLLENRVDYKPMPGVEVVDMRAELQRGNAGIFSNILLQKIDEKINRKEQVLLFINRRGFAPIVICRKCGFVLKCPHCDISLTYHNDSRLRCHYCNYTISKVDICPGCGAEHIRYSGIGTQKVEEEIKRIFPSVRVLRMDADTTSRKGAHEKILKTFLKGEANILVGTQMIAKGLNLPRVTLVGVINADTTLHMPDFRAAEKTFQLLTQVAGRAGRGTLPGEVIVQTYDPDHYSIITARKHDYTSFFNKEMKVRRALGYPPFSRLIRIVIYGKEESSVCYNAHLLKESLVTAGINIAAVSEYDVLGPAPAPLHKIKQKYRWQIFLKGKSGLDLRKITKTGLDIFNKRSQQRLVAVSVDVEPQNMM
ncbi:primosomal protein N' [Desulfolucanica intricata]|uniref:primosomal protein N' n=1 Tax=Desulfolucanica intricata TaxID=1285191 RepID=UPI000835B7C3|nr:primosomal protein N' [Desulfolucanica intricata]